MFFASFIEVPQQPSDRGINYRMEPINFTILFVNFTCLGIPGTDARYTNSIIQLVLKNEMTDRISHAAGYSIIQNDLNSVPKESAI